MMNMLYSKYVFLPFYLWKKNKGCFFYSSCNRTITMFKELGFQGRKIKRFIANKTVYTCSVDVCQTSLYVLITIDPVCDLVLAICGLCPQIY